MMSSKRTVPRQRPAITRNEKKSQIRRGLNRPVLRPNDESSSQAAILPPTPPPVLPSTRFIYGWTIDEKWKLMHSARAAGKSLIVVADRQGLHLKMLRVKVLSTSRRLLAFNTTNSDPYLLTNDTNAQVIVAVEKNTYAVIGNVSTYASGNPYMLRCFIGGYEQMEKYFPLERRVFNYSFIPTQLGEYSAFKVPPVSHLAWTGHGQYAYDTRASGSCFPVAGVASTLVMARFILYACFIDYIQCTLQQNNNFVKLPPFPTTESSWSTLAEGQMLVALFAVESCSEGLTNAVKELTASDDSISFSLRINLIDKEEEVLAEDEEHTEEEKEEQEPNGRHVKFEALGTYPRHFDRAVRSRIGYILI